MPKNVKGGALLDLLTNIPLQNIKKLKGGTLWGHEKIFEKKSHSSEKNPKGGPFGHVRFCIFLEKVKNERGDPLEYVYLGRTWPQVLCAEL